MNILDLQTIRGPNVFHHKPVLIMTLDLGELADVSSAELPDFVPRLLTSLPGLHEHHCSLQRAGGFVERLHRGTYLAHIIEHVSLELSEAVGISVGYGKSIYGGAPGIYKVIVRYRSEAGMRYLLRSAVEFVRSLIAGESFDWQERIARAKSLVDGERLGPSTQAIVDAAERRNIPWIRLNHSSLIQFGYGKNRRIIQATETERTSNIAVEIAQDKHLTKEVLRQAHIPVPRGEVVATEQEALQAFVEIGGVIAVKPLDGNQGKGVSLQLQTNEEVIAAFQVARQFSRQVLVEEQLMGNDFRILIVNGKLVAAAKRIPARVVGDGTTTVGQLIAKENQSPLRGDGHEKPMSKIKVDELVRACLLRQGQTLESVPAAGDIVYLRESANLSTGGCAVDVTDEVHPDIRAVCERAARIVGLDVCGIDLIAKDIASPLQDQGGGIIEVNASPGIRMHHFPSQGKPRDAGEAILESLYPRGSSARIPIISITGTNGKTTVTRLISHIFNESGYCAGTTTSDGIYIGKHCVVEGDTTGPISARTVLNDPAVDIAVLETARGGLMRRGLAYDWSDIGILTNVQADHIGQDGIEDVEDILHAKKLVAERVRPGGTLILNADDERLANLPQNLYSELNSRKIVFFSLHPNNITLERHRRAGGLAYYFKQGFLYEGKGKSEIALVRAVDIPMTYGGTADYQIANALAVIAACSAQGLDLRSCLRALISFHPNRDNSGRGNIYRVGRGYIMVDYGHNPEAIRAISTMLARWKARRITGVLGVPGDRSDDMIRQSGRAAARGFSRLIIREDIDLRGREPGETARLICEAVHKENPHTQCIVELDSAKAFGRAVQEMEEGEILVFFYDEFSLIEGLLRQHDATPLFHPSTIESTDFPFQEVA